MNRVADNKIGRVASNMHLTSDDLSRTAGPQARRRQRLAGCVIALAGLLVAAAAALQLARGVHLTMPVALLTMVLALGILALAGTAVAVAAGRPPRGVKTPSR